jgi:hypothetical protein
MKNPNESISFFVIFGYRSDYPRFVPALRSDPISIN